MKPIRIIYTVLIAYCSVMQVADCAQKSPVPFSTYGQIQNVQNYSSNPFWTKDSPYNLRMPTPIYATGPDLTTGDCNRVVGNLVASFCASNDCSNKKISDVRPTIMVNLSQLPGHNFATSCGGYIDQAFENYKKTHGNVSTDSIVKTATTTKSTNNTLQTTNLFAKKPSTYAQGVAERTAELENLQKQNTPTPKVKAADFPKTIDDLSLTERMAIAAEGYEPYKDKSAYKTPTFGEEDSDFYERLKLANPTEFCRRRPNDAFCRPPEDNN
ncbi:MAG: hypothetical protein J5613_02420, partial [Alphaproteobacteria bacterium]|nr:hypothetical protein [Alphaproteobacteria bacterium]